jgi:hypothetical protein
VTLSYVSLFRLVDLEVGAVVTTPALQLAAHWSLAILDKGTGGGEGGEEDMMVVEGQDVLTWHIGLRVTDQLKME